jgi:hypothetical protein
LMIGFEKGWDKVLGFIKGPPSRWYLWEGGFILAQIYVFIITIITWIMPTSSPDSSKLVPAKSKDRQRNSKFRVASIVLFSWSAYFLHLVRQGLIKHTLLTYVYQMEWISKVSFSAN